MRYVTILAVAAKQRPYSFGLILTMMHQGPTLVEWIPDVQLELHLPSRTISKPRPYSNVVFDPSTSLLVAASSLQAKFSSFDEDSNLIWEPDGASFPTEIVIRILTSAAPNVSFPFCESSTLELISPDTWVSMDG